jgi:hypothetical protein
MTRQCARNGCGHVAVATLSYNYGQRTVWIEHVTDEPHPSTYDLCALHADHLSVPGGWILTDSRARPLFDVAAS